MEMIWVEEPPIGLGATSPRPPMDEQDRFTCRVAALFPVELMRFADFELTSLVRLDLRIEVQVGHPVSVARAPRDGELRYG